MIALKWRNKIIAITSAAALCNQNTRTNTMAHRSALARTGGPASNAHARAQTQFEAPESLAGRAKNHRNL